MFIRTRSGSELRGNIEREKRKFQESFVRGRLMAGARKILENLIRKLPPDPDIPSSFSEPPFPRWSRAAVNCAII